MERFTQKLQGTPMNPKPRTEDVRAWTLDALHRRKKTHSDFELVPSAEIRMIETLICKYFFGVIGQDDAVHGLVVEELIGIGCSCLSGIWIGIRMKNSPTFGLSCVQEAGNSFRQRKS
jgi:hypothetical protein